MVSRHTLQPRLYDVAVLTLVTRPPPIGRPCHTIRPPAPSHDHLCSDRHADHAGLARGADGAGRGGQAAVGHEEEAAAR